LEQKLINDINSVSGTLTQAYATSPGVTLRKSLTKLENQGYDASAIVLSPADWEAVELSLATTNAIEHLALPYDAAARRLYGVPVVVCVREAAGVGHVLARDAVALDVGSQGTGIQWNESSEDLFTKNLIIARCEGRYATSVYRPAGVVVADLTP
jgi:Phage capsid family